MIKLAFFILQKSKLLPLVIWSALAHERFVRELYDIFFFWKLFPCCFVSEDLLTLHSSPYQFFVIWTLKQLLVLKNIMLNSEFIEWHPFRRKVLTTNKLEEVTQPRQLKNCCLSFLSRHWQKRYLLITELLWFL